MRAGGLSATASGVRAAQAQEEAKKEKQNRRDHWLDTDIVIKVRNKKLADGKYDGKKGTRELLSDVVAASGPVALRAGRPPQPSPSALVPTPACMRGCTAGGGVDGAPGVVVKVIDKYMAEIEMIDTGDVIRVDQAHCETVLPVRARAHAKRARTCSRPVRT